MKLERGIIEINQNKSYIMSVGHYFNLNETYIIPTDLKNNQKVLGINTGNKLEICYNFELYNGKIIFGYILNQFNHDNYLIQIIDGYSELFYNPYNSIVKPSNQLNVNKNEIKSIAIVSF